MNRTNEQVMKEYAHNEVAPVLVEYTKWIINECVKRKLHKVYFLARDGYLLCELAKEICKANNLQIECKYLYCSRYSLRMPSYHLIGEEAYKLLFLKGYYYTVKSVLQRAGLTEQEIEDLLKQLEVENSNDVLNEDEFENLVKKLKNNDYFNKILEKKSKIAYKTTIEYFKEQGLFDDENIVIADSGWTGSMQRSLRQLVRSAGYKGKIIGFYFGLTVEQKEEDGLYLAYYFNHNCGKKRKVMFNNNLFECMLSANHGMTMGYEQTQNGVKPVLKEMDNDKMLDLINLQIFTILQYAKENQEKLKIIHYDLKKSIEESYKHLKRVMIYPRREEVEMLCNFMFCDDVTEGYHMSLADKSMTKALKSNMVIPKICRKLFHKKNKQDLFWPHGVIVYQPKILRPWYRFNLKLWNTLRYSLKK